MGLHHLQAGAHPVRREIDRLLAEDRFAGLGGALDEIGVGVGRRADRHRVDVLGGQNLLDRAGLRPRRLRQRAGRAGVRVGDHRHRAIAAPRDIAGVNLADPPGPDDPELHRILPCLTASKKE